MVQGLLLVLLVLIVLLVLLVLIVLLVYGASLLATRRRERQQDRKKAAELQLVRWKEGRRAQNIQDI